MLTLGRLKKPGFYQVFFTCVTYAAGCRQFWMDQQWLDILTAD